MVDGADVRGGAAATTVSAPVTRAYVVVELDFRGDSLSAYQHTLRTYVARGYELITVSGNRAYVRRLLRETATESGEPTPARPPTWSQVNLNDVVRVKFTELGVRIYRDYWSSARTTLRDPVDTLRTDADGWTEFQLWDLARTFGCHMGNGMPVPFETSVLVRSVPVAQYAGSGR